MKTNSVPIQFRQRATPFSYALFLVALLLVQLTTFYEENCKLLPWLKMMLSDRSNGTANSIHISKKVVSSTNTRTGGTTNASPITDESPPNQHAILMIHYHKTGFVLSRDLRSHAIQLFNQYIMDRGLNPALNFTMPSKKTWGSIQRPRQFGPNLCPGVFDLQRGVIHVQESPDFYCNVDEMARILLQDEGHYERVRTKIVHFVRNPYSMALSNYYYHAQVPTLVSFFCIDL
jgi:hypothetical protein